MDRAAADVGVDFIGGFSALVHKGVGAGEDALIRSIRQRRRNRRAVCASVNVRVNTRGHQHGRRGAHGRAVKETAALTAAADGIAQPSSWSSATWSRTTLHAGAVHGSGEADVW